MTSSSKNQLFFLFAFMAIGAIIGVANAKPPSRISGAEDAEPGVYKWVVSISDRPSKGRVSTVCGGAIISKRHILTAAHCVYGQNPSTFIIHAGFIHLYDVKNATVSKVTKVIPHPDFVDEHRCYLPYENDIAILELEKDLNLGDSLIKTSLPNSLPVNNQRGSFAGWGNIYEDTFFVPTMTLRTADVRVLDDEECHAKYIPSEYQSCPVGPQFFCGIQQNGNILSGDSGSPVVTDGEVIGIASSGLGIVGTPDIYTNVYYYRQWIKSIVDPYSSA